MIGRRRGTTEGRGPRPLTGRYPHAPTHATTPSSSLEEPTIRACSLLLCLWLFATTSGCGTNGSKWSRVHVTGTVTYEGQPVPDGSITLRPAAGTAGPAAGAAIVNGDYEIPEGDGPALGTYQATITVVMFNGPRVNAGPRDIPEMHRFEQEVEFEEAEERKNFVLPPP